MRISYLSQQHELNAHVNPPGCVNPVVTRRKPPIQVYFIKYSNGFEIDLIADFFDGWQLISSINQPQNKRMQRTLNWYVTQPELWCAARRASNDDLKISQSFLRRTILVKCIAMDHFEFFFDSLPSFHSDHHHSTLNFAWSLHCAHVHNDFGNLCKTGRLNIPSVLARGIWAESEFLFTKLPFRKIWSYLEYLFLIFWAL